MNTFEFTPAAGRHRGRKGKTDAPGAATDEPKPKQEAQDEQTPEGQAAVIAKLSASLVRATLSYKSLERIFESVKMERDEVAGALLDLQRRGVIEPLKSNLVDAIIASHDCEVCMLFTEKLVADFELAKQQFPADLLPDTPGNLEIWNALLDRFSRALNETRGKLVAFAKENGIKPIQEVARYW